MGLPWGSLLFVLTGALVSAAVLENYYPKQNITCSQGLAQCKVKEESPLVLPVFDPVEILHLDAKPMLCCRENRKCKVCLYIRILLRILPNEDEREERSEEHEENDDETVVTVCYISGPYLPHCWKVSFIVSPAARKNHEKAELSIVQYDGVFLGTTVNVTVKSMIRSVTFPPLSEVCPSADIEECKTPKVIMVIDRQRGVAELKDASKDLPHAKPLLMCVKRGRTGTCRNFPSSKWTIPLHAISPCLCFQAWREESAYSRSGFCPFSNYTEFQKNVVSNVSLSVAHALSNEGLPVLSWNLTAPCRLDVELWLCRIEADSGGHCRELQGNRVHVSTDSQWQENATTLWTSDAFVNLDIHAANHFMHCVMFKIEEETFGPLCQYDVHRGRWSLPVFVTLLVFSVAVLGMFVIWSKLTGWHSNWTRSHRSKDGLGKVLLLHACSSEKGQDHLVCGLGTVLRDLGFVVYLDLWNQSEVSSVGPAPWLHSRLGQLKHSGRALIVLSSSALERARGFWDVWLGGKDEERPRPDTKADEILCDKNLPGISSDVFGSALSCILRDHLKGAAGKHFALVQFDSQKLIKGEKDVPELFRGLRLYQLPSETRQLLMELHRDRPKSISTQLKMVLWLSKASRRLVKGLKNPGTDVRTCAESMLTQMDNMTMERQGEETFPLTI
ncbi:uncharacterized protein il17rc [Brachyhypopomus gauderio]|uniref:uncharacterized protein il17rc n=1 Tax=Brachyhypopomus gauderio TaxID=698409 RepID=UPI004042E71C